jgi:cyclopropane fatty-acyl-phospholipid synthase-like methyltransferase
MRWNTPLSLEHAGLLMDRLDLRPGLRIADLGCGWGELLLQVVARAMASGGAADDGGGHTAGGAGAGGAGAGGAAAGQTTGIGVDTDQGQFARGRRLARERGLDRHVRFAEGDAAAWPETADRVLCIGASHAFGGTERALAALAATVPPGGRLLYGDGYWENPPAAAATEALGDGILPLPGLLEACRAAGWRVIHLSTADQREWDDFESTFRAGRQEWLIEHDGDPRAAEVRDWLDAREREYVGVYRRVLGLAYLVLAH